MPTRCFKPNSMATQQHGGRGLSPRPCDRCAAGRGRPAAAANPPLRPADEPCPTPTPTTPHLTFAHDSNTNCLRWREQPAFLHNPVQLAYTVPSRGGRGDGATGGTDSAGQEWGAATSKSFTASRRAHRNRSPPHRGQLKPATMPRSDRLKARSTPGKAAAPSAARPLRTRTTWRSPSETRSPFLPPQPAILLSPPSPALPP